MSLASALRSGDLAELPSRKDEDWHWTDLHGLIRAVPPRSLPGNAVSLPSGPFAGLADEEIVFLNGRRLSGGGKVSVAAGETRTVALRFISQTRETAHYCALGVSVEPGGRLTLLESYEGPGAAYIADVELDIRLEEDAQVERIVVIDEAADAIAVATAGVVLGAHADYAQTTLTSGAKRQRAQTRLAHGKGARARIDGVYLLAGERRGDLTSEVVHAHPNGSTSQLTKGCVRDQARGVFQGRIIVSRGADGTDARMGHHALILSERAEVDAKPELEIYADDVACTHGNTVGALDEEALFYIEQRGVPKAEARMLLTAAFVGEVVDRIEHEGAREIARAWVADRLRGSR